MLSFSSGETTPLLIIDETTRTQIQTQDGKVRSANSSFVPCRPLSVTPYLIDELRDADDVTLAVEDRQAEHRLRDEAVAVLQVLAEPRAHVAQVQDLE